MRPRKPVVIDSRLCRLLELEEGEERPTCRCCGAHPARWLSLPPDEELVRQVKDDEGLPDPWELCSLCALYETSLLKGQHARVKRLVGDVERETRRVFPKKAGRLTRPKDADRIVASVVLGSVAFERRDVMLRVLARENEDLAEKMEFRDQIVGEVDSLTKGMGDV